MAIKNEQINFEDIDIKTFQERVLDGTYNDDKVRAYLLINGTVMSSYHLYLDRRIVTTTGQVISPQSILKKFEDEDLKIRIVPKKDYAFMRLQYVYKLKNRLA